MATQIDATAGTGSRGFERPAGRSGGRDRGAGLTPYLFLAPYLVLFTVFVLVPALYGLWISLHTWDFLLPNKPFVGLQNYLNLMTRETAVGDSFWQSMGATGKFTLYSVPLLLVIPLLIALVLNKKFPGRTFFRAVFFAPYVLGVAVIGLLWRFLLDPTAGLLNYLLNLLPWVDGNIPWTTATPWVWVSLVAATVWWTLGFNAVIYLAGLQDISPDLYEAASVDGAKTLQKFFYITLPSLKRVLLLVTTLTVLASANMFGQALLITQGAPGTETRTAIMYIAEEGLGNFRMGNAAAMSYILALFLILASLAIFAFFRRFGED
ncbi:MAG: sugar ABC transporter permease [Actinomycetota bacterium]|nr:sugar ABC transporter permease [Actinomycetota bacterium]